MRPKQKDRKLRHALRCLQGEKGLVGAEIGVQWGLHAQTILSLLDIKTLYLIDPYTEFGDTLGRISCSAAEHRAIRDYAHKHLADYDDKVVWLEDYSIKAVRHIPDESLDFVYIDGDHRYEFVKQDIELYLPKVKVGGLIAGHDYGQARNGVEKAVRQVFGKNHNTGGRDWWTIKD